MGRRYDVARWRVERERAVDADSGIGNSPTKNRRRPQRQRNGTTSLHIRRVVGLCPGGQRVRGIVSSLATCGPVAPGTPQENDSLSRPGRSIVREKLATARVHASHRSDGATIQGNHVVSTEPVRERREDKIARLNRNIKDRAIELTNDI